MAFGNYIPAQYGGGYAAAPQYGAYQNYPPPQMQQTQEAFACRPVTSKEEAVATPADFMRPIILPDMAHGMVYIKRFNPATGVSDILDFKLMGDMPNTVPAGDFVTRQEFDKFCADLMRRIASANREVATSDE